MFGFGDKVKLAKDGVEARKGDVRVIILKSAKGERAKTGNVFLDRIVNGLSENSPFFVNIESGGAKEKIIENSGFAIGLGLKRLSGSPVKDHASYIHTDGKSMCMFSLDMNGDIKGSAIQLIGKPKEFDPEDMFAFFDSLSQGMDSEISGVINLEKQKKEIEFVSAAFAGSLKQMFG